MLIERAKAVTIEAAKRRAAQVVAAATIGLAEVRRPKCKIFKERRRTGSGADKRANASKTSSEAAVAIVGAAAVADGGVAVEEVAVAGAADKS